MIDQQSNGGVYCRSLLTSYKRVGQPRNVSFAPLDKCQRKTVWGGLWFTESLLIL